MAAVVLGRPDEVLLVRRTVNGFWSLPSGHVERGETVEEAVCREVLEETGLTVEVARLVGAYSDPASQVIPYPTGEVNQFATSCSECKVMGDALPADGNQSTEVAFFNLHRLPPDLLPMHSRLLADALSGKSRLHKTADFCNHCATRLTASQIEQAERQRNTTHWAWT